jgi:hypothetical protein
MLFTGISEDGSKRKEIWSAILTKPVVMSAIEAY